MLDNSSTNLKEGKRRVIFRADGNSYIGLGHVVRSLALVEMLRSEEFRIVFAIQQPNHLIEKQLREICDGVVVLPKK